MIKNFNNLILIEGGASRKKIYRLKCNKFNLIVLDFSDDVNEFDKHLNVYNILKDINKITNLTTQDLLMDLDYQTKGIHPDSWADDLNQF